jgi:hypothetical protein
MNIIQKLTITLNIITLLCSLYTLQGIIKVTKRKEKLQRALEKACERLEELDYENSKGTDDGYWTRYEWEWWLMKDDE